MGFIDLLSLLATLIPLGLLVLAFLGLLVVIVENLYPLYYKTHNREVASNLDHHYL